MLKSQKLEIKSVEIRKRLAELAGMESLDDETRSELDAKTVELRDTESQRVAALELEGIESETRETETEDAETRERKALLGRSRLGNVLSACIEGKPLSGAEMELRSAYGMSGDYEIPHEIFEPMEERAITPAPSDDTQVNQRPVQPYLYQRGVAGFLGIDMPRVPSGTPAFPVLTTGTPAGPKAKGATADQTAAAFTMTTAAPRRVTGSFKVAVEDLAVFPQMESALRRDVPQSMVNAVENQLLNGDGSPPNINGILQRLTNPTPQGSQNDPQTYVSTIAGVLDGVHGYEIADLRTLVGKQTYAAMVSKYFSNTAVSTAAYLAEHFGGIRMTNRLPVVASNVQPGIVRVGNMGMCAVSAVWGGVSLVRDIYSGAGEGEITVTAYQLISDVHILRSGAFQEVSFYP